MSVNDLLERGAWVFVAVWDGSSQLKQMPVRL